MRIGLAARPLARSRLRPSFETPASRAQDEESHGKPAGKFKKCPVKFGILGSPLGFADLQGMKASNGVTFNGI
jgi:hypothetical protein